MGWWGKSQDSKSEQQKEAAKPEVLDPKLPTSEHLPKALQKIVDTAEDGGLFDDINDT
jgi:hypothetical protein